MGSEVLMRKMRRALAAGLALSLLGTMQGGLGPATAVLLAVLLSAELAGCCAPGRLIPAGVLLRGVLGRKLSTELLV